LKLEIRTSLEPFFAEALNLFRSLSVFATIPTGVTGPTSAVRFAHVVGRTKGGRDILISYSEPIAVLSVGRPGRQTQTKQQ